jgi:hypothetical protein
MDVETIGRLHHLELWVPDLEQAVVRWGWLLGDRQQVDSLVARAPSRGWRLLFPDKHPHAGGPDHYAAYLADSDGFEVELVAS